MKVRVPSDFDLTIYIIDGKNGFSKFTRFEEIIFDPDLLMIDYKNRAILEKELNELPTRLYRFERLLNLSQNLLDSLYREETIYKSQRHVKAGNTGFKNIAEKDNHLTATLIEDPIIAELWTAIGHVRAQTEELKIIVKSLTSHTFKCKDFFNDKYSQRSESSTSDF
jgi:hypothetical protein